VNSICIVGRLTEDPQRKDINGKVVVEFSVAVNRFKKDEADFFRVKAWGQTAEFVSSYLSKGRLVSVHGRMESRKAERDGRSTTYWDLVADSVNGLDKKPDGDTMTASPQRNRTRYSPEPAPPPPLPGELDIEDPFA